MNRRRQWSLRKKILSGMGAFVLLLLLLGVVGYVLTDIPKPSDRATNQATSIRYADGPEIGRVGTDNRKLVPLTKVSDPAQKAVLAAEDRGFYSEPGISPRGIFRAAVANLKGGGVQQGGSTITQQYAKNAYLTQQRTFTRKFKEFFISLKLSQKLSKDQILENYLNTIYFGRGASGIEVAANTYFNVPAERLTVAQAAVLAASIRSPAAYDPTRHPERAEQRWNYVLDGMVKKRWLAADERAGMTYPKVLQPGQGGGRNNDRQGPKGYILDQVEEELARHGFPEDQLAAGGYVVHTTIRAKAQAAAVSSVEGAVPPVKNEADKHTPRAALVSIAAQTGEVFAYYGGSTGNGGTDFAADDPQQPGSSFKPYVLATALEQGKGLGTKYDGSAPQKICGTKVDNDEGDPALGRVDLVKGLALSVNTVYFRLACDVGPKKVADLAHRAGISSARPLARDGVTAAGIGLGIYEVSVLDQATGYATFANGGEHQEVHFVKDVKQGDEVVYMAKENKDQAFGEDVAADATYAMQQVVKNGTGTRAQLDGRPTAGKTGTTQDNRDAWFCGFTPQLATAVWVGRQDNQPLKGALGVEGGVYGGTIPAKVFKQYMDTALEGRKVEEFPKRANVGKNADTSSGGSFRPAPTTQSSPTSAPTDLPTSLPTQVPSTQAPPPSPEPSNPPPSSQAPPPSPEPPSPQPSPAAT